MAEMAGGRVAKGVIDEFPLPPEKRIISFSPSRCNEFLGMNLAPESMVQALAGIELNLSGTGDDLTLEPPTFRFDLTREVDLYEEVARLIGYDEIPVSLPDYRSGAEAQPRPVPLRAMVRTSLQGLGLSEAITYSFIGHDFCDRLGLPEDDPRRRTVQILNPLSEEQALLRTTLVPGLLQHPAAQPVLPGHERGALRNRHGLL